VKKNYASFQGEYELQVFVVLRKVFGSKKYEISGKFRMLHSEEHALYRLNGERWEVIMGWICSPDVGGKKMDTEFS
jgi:hypothetical protein